MPGETLKRREPQTPTDTPPGAPAGIREPGEDPDGRDETNSEILAQLRALNEQAQTDQKRNRDKDRHIGTLQSELASLRDAQRTAADAGGSAAEEIERGITAIDGGAIAKVIEDAASRKAEEMVRQAAPQILDQNRRHRMAEEGFEKLRKAGVETPPEELKLHEKLSQLDPYSAHVGALVNEGRTEEAYDLLGKQRDAAAKEKAKAEVIALMSDPSPEGKQELRKYLDIHGQGPARPGQSGYSEGEDPSLMYELSLAPHARKVKDDEWVDDLGL